MDITNLMHECRVLGSMVADAGDAAYDDDGARDQYAMILALIDAPNPDEGMTPREQYCYDAFCAQITRCALRIARNIMRDWIRDQTSIMIDASFRAVHEPV